MIVLSYCIRLPLTAESETFYIKRCGPNKQGLPYNSKSVMGERTAPHFIGDSSPLSNRLVT